MQFPWFLFSILRESFTRVLGFPGPPTTTLEPDLKRAELLTNLVPLRFSDVVLIVTVTMIVALVSHRVLMLVTIVLSFKVSRPCLLMAECWRRIENNIHHETLKSRTIQSWSRDVPAC